MSYCHLTFLTLAAVIGCGVPQPAGQAEAIRQLQQLKNSRGERMIIEGVGTGKIVASVPFNDGTGGGWNDEDFLASVPYLQRIPQLDTLRFINTHVTDAGLSGLEKLPQVRELYFHDNQFSDAGLEPMQHMDSLESLICDSVLPLKRNGEWTDTRLTGVGFEHLHSLPKFTSLELIATAVNDEGVEAISGLPHLERLTLSQANLITDAALESLGRMTRLKKLVVGGKRLTFAAQARLKQKLPETEIVFSAG